MRALVTGANGHLGFNLVQALLARGDEVRAGVRAVADVGKSEALRALPGVEVVGADLGQPAQLRAAMDGIDTLFHVAAVFATTVSGGQEPHLFGGEGAAAVCGFGMACAGAVLSTSFS